MINLCQKCISNNLVTYSACGPFTKNKERIENFMQTGNTDFMYKNELDKASGMA